MRSACKRRVATLARLWSSGKDAQDRVSAESTPLLPLSGRPSPRERLILFSLITKFPLS